VRLFLAINLPSAVRREIFDATSALRDAAPDLAWVSEPRLHLTLKFLGEQPEAAAGVVRAEMDVVADRHKSLAIRLGGIGAFPNFRRSRVVWMGVAQEPRLELLHHDVETACEKIGYEIDGRAFRPHLTLGRVKHPLDEARARELSRAGKRITYDTEVLVESVDLVRSELSGQGSVYTVVSSSALRSA
jgi:RNA 2',3'-cyclic 3'-phosphodiesterase